MKNGKIQFLSKGIVRPNAANGQQAFTQTAQFRGDIPPDNCVASMGYSSYVFANPLLAQLAEKQIFSDDFKRVTTLSSAFAG